MGERVRYCVSWALYGLGDFFWRVFGGRCYRLYNWLMWRSCIVQGAGPGPWKGSSDD